MHCAKNRCGTRELLAEAEESTPYSMWETELHALKNGLATYYEEKAKMTIQDEFVQASSKSGKPVAKASRGKKKAWRHKICEEIVDE